MLSFIRMLKVNAAIIAAVIMLAGFSTPSHAQTGTGSVRIHIVRAGFIVGVGGGHGTLIFQGRKFRLRIGGVSVGTVGISGADLVGTAYNLWSARDIAGVYGSAGASFSIVGGARVVRLQNANGVVLELQGPQVGFDLSLNLSGMTITMR